MGTYKAINKSWCRCMVWVISSKDHVELFINEYSKEGDL